ncbi:MAG: hypothetical protein ACFCUN_14470 [Hyphomicrobiaceae bacterium]
MSNTTEVAAGGAEQALAETIAARMPDRTNNDEDLLRRATWFDADWLLSIGPAEFHISQRAGRIVAFERGPFFMRAWSFALDADAGSWLEHWQPVPRPGYQDLLALSKIGRLRILGDLTPLMRNLQVVKDTVASVRGSTPHVLTALQTEGRV